MRGSVVKRGSVWYIKYDMPRRKGEKRRPKMERTAARTRARAEAYCAERIAEIARGVYVEPDRMPLGDYLDQWLSGRATLANTTRERFDLLIKNQIRPHIGTLPLIDVTPVVLERLYADLRKGGSVERGPLSERTVLHVHRLLGKALQDAARLGRLARNPARVATAPKPNRAKVRVLGRLELERYLEKLRGSSSRHYIAALLAGFCGLRRGEVLALRWVDVDLTLAVVRVIQSLEQSKTHDLRYKSPKNGKPRAKMAPGLVLDALRAHKIEQALQQEALGDAYTDHGLIVCAPSGAPWRPSTFSTSFRDEAKRLGFAGLSFHGLRHSEATMEMEVGVPLKVISEGLGHSSIAVTSDLYGHVTSTMQAQAVSAVDRAFRGYRRRAAEDRVAKAVANGSVEAEGASREGRKSA